MSFAFALKSSGSWRTQLANQSDVHIKIGFKTIQKGVDWATLLDTWTLADELVVFESGWLNDHFLSWRDGLGSHEAWTIASALAARTSRLQFGHLVLSNTYRHAPLLAKMSTTLDEVSNGRFVLGLGAGWQVDEHEMFGWPLPPLGERISMLEDATLIAKGIWASSDGFTYESPFYRVVGAKCMPSPLTPGGPPIWIGTHGKVRGLRIVAQYADGWTTTEDDGVAAFAERRDALLNHCDSFDRDHASVEISVRVTWKKGTSAAVLATAEEFVKAGATHIIFGLPAASGSDGLRLLAREVAEPFRASHP
jgi:alkanesulfonate monooxygenase SsuD/methylene tetrahydromethanopterin reductase-like flavin-dependent oxidoreductase (luciferase family)